MRHLVARIAAAYVGLARDGGLEVQLGGAKGLVGGRVTAFLQKLQMAQRMARLTYPMPSKRITAIQEPSSATDIT